MRLIHPTSRGTELDTEALATAYAYPDGPWVRANFVSTADGSAQGADRRSGTIASSADTRLFAILRALADVILVGAGTTRAEGYQPVEPEPWQRDLRARLGLAPAPAIAVLTVSGVIDDGLRAGGAAPTFVYAGDGGTDLGVVLDDLRDKGLRHVLCEGGPSVFAQLVAAGRLDELCLTLSPLVVGGQGLRITDGPGLDPAWQAGLGHVIEDDGSLFLRYVRAA